MLKDVSLWLSEQGYITSIIGRSREKHLALKKKALRPELIRPIMVDYHKHSLLEDSIKRAIEQFGPISLVVSWTPNYKTLKLVDQLISQSSNRWTLFQVKGSRRYFNDEPLKLSPKCDHRSIYLGFILEGDSSRWLTNEEISKGVIHSIEKDCKESIIGTLHPYEKRPKY